MSELATRPSAKVAIDEEAVLKHLGIDARNPAAQALILTCERYGLDPILKHAVLIQGRLYVTRDGLLHVAHASKQLDGIEVLEQGADNTHFIAKVAVYRKDMSKPFAYVGRYPKAGSNKNYGPEMAVKCAEVMALRRAFDVGIAAKEEVWDQDIETTATSKVEEGASDRKDEGPPQGALSKEGPAVDPAENGIATPSSQPVEGDASGRETEGQGPLPDESSPSASDGGAPVAEKSEPATLTEEEERDAKDRLQSLLEQAVDGGITVRGVKLTPGKVGAKAVRLASSNGLPMPKDYADFLKTGTLALLQLVVDDLELEKTVGTLV